MDRYAVTCNYDVSRNVASAGAKCYVANWQCGDPSRIRLVVRSRSGRWIEKWERTSRLRDFRVKTIVDEHYPRSPNGAPVLFESRDSAEQEADKWRAVLKWCIAERDRPREFHDPGDEDRR